MKKKPNIKPILILGVGNLLLMDEGLGIHFAHELQKRDLSPSVEVMDGGARGIDFLPLFQGRELVIIVDCARTGAAPGTIRQFAVDDVIGMMAKGFTVHGASLPQTLALGKKLDILPEVIVIGVEPETVEIGTELSETARLALKEVERMVEEIIASRS